mgnify:FL=1|tara:strand:+ start:2377 stop:3468 length:1092 start_codon:yes stop_codon:yes gene_type:complete
MKAGIVGLPNVGKSTLFNCLSDSKAQSENFPFCTIDPNISIINVPDSRLDHLKEIVDPEKLIPTTVKIVDIAGLVKGASKGEGLGNKFLSNIRETDAILHVLRCFDDPNIVHVDGRVDPVNDKEIVQYELQLKDLEIVNKRLEKLKKTLRSGNDDSKKEILILEKIKNNLEDSIINKDDFNEDDYLTFIKPLELITFKPVLYVCNVSENDLLDDNQYVKKVKEFASKENAEVILISAKIESEINELDSLEEKKIFLEDIGVQEPGSSKLIRSTYNLLNLHTFFTAGKKEVRAWTVGIGQNAYDAAGQIHSDFQKGFICSEVISYNDYIDNGSEIKSKEAGKMRLEGKDYIVEDGDIMHFRFNI